MKRCPIAAKIGAVFSHRGMNVCPICEAFLSRRTVLYVCEFESGSDNRVYNVSRISLVGNNKNYKKRREKKARTAPISKPTYDHKQETFSLALEVI